jgi:cell division septum initiation protein DivIVA
MVVSAARSIADNCLQGNTHRINQAKKAILRRKRVATQRNRDQCESEGPHVSYNASQSSIRH